MDPALIGAMGGAGGLLSSAANIGVPIGLSFYGAKRAASEAKKSFRRQIALRRTAYQDTVYDLKQAGLNPILALRGANSLGSVQSGRVPDFAGAAVAGARQASESRSKGSQRQLMSLQQQHLAQLSASESVKQREGLARIREHDARTNHINAQTRHLGTQLPRASTVQDLYSGEFGAALAEIQEATKTFGSVGTALGTVYQLRRLAPSSMPPRLRKLKMIMEDALNEGRGSLEALWNRITGRSNEPTPKGPPRDPYSALNDFSKHGWEGEEMSHRPWLKRWDGTGDIPE